MPKKLKLQHRQFAILMAPGNIPAVKAYMECYPDTSYDSARSSSADLLANPSIQEEIKRIRGLVEQDAVLSVEEKRKFLASAVRTPLSEMDTDNPLATEYTITKDGIKVKAFSKEKAIEIDNKMAGHNEAEVVKHEYNLVWGEEEQEEEKND